MSNFLNMAQQAFTAYENSSNSNQSNPAPQGGPQYNGPHTQYQGSGTPDLDDNHIVNSASQYGSGDPSLFSSALGFVKNNTSAHQEPVDEQNVQDAHQQAYQQGNGANLSAGSMGSAAALQALKMFTSGQSSGNSSGGNMQSQLISMAMSEASNLFEQSGGSATGSKQDVVNSAGMTVMKLLVQSKFSGMMGGQNSGGLGELGSIASKFF